MLALLPPRLAQRLDRLSLVMRYPLYGSGQGERRSRRWGSSLEFADHRAYVQGDDPARLDWNVFGRSGQLQIKVFEAEELMSVSIILDASASMRWGNPDKFERARQIAAALAYLGLAGGNRVSLLTLQSGSARPSRAYWGRQQTPELLRLLAAQQPDEPVSALNEQGGSLEQMVRRSQRVGVGNGAAERPQLAILISDLLSATWQEAIRALLKPGSELIVLHVLDEAETDPSLGGDLNLLDQETGARVPVTLNAEVVAWYRAHARAWLAEVAEFCTRRGIRYARHVTSGSLENWVYRDLRERGILR